MLPPRSQSHCQISPVIQQHLDLDSRSRSRTVDGTFTNKARKTDSNRLKSELQSLSSLHSIKAAASRKAKVFEFMARSSALMHKVAHGEYQNDAERLLNARKPKGEHSQLRTVDCDQAKGDYVKLFMPSFCALGDNDDNTNQRRRLDSRMIAGPGVHQISPKPHGKTANLHHGAGRRDGGEARTTWSH